MLPGRHSIKETTASGLFKNPLLEMQEAQNPFAGAIHELPLQERTPPTSLARARHGEEWGWRRDE